MNTTNEAALELFKTHTPKELIAEYKANNNLASIGTMLSFAGTSLTLNNFFGGFWANFDLTRELQPQQLLFTAFALLLGYIGARVMAKAFRSKTANAFNAIVIVILIAFNLSTESANGGDRAEMGMRQLSIESPEFKTAQQIALNASNQSNTYTPSPALIQAEAKVGELNALMQRCTELHSKEKDINWCQRKPSRELATWDAKLAALQNAEQRQMQLIASTSSTASTQALAQMKELGRNEENYNMLIRVIQQATGLSGFAANMAASIFIVIVLMFCIAWVARNLNNTSAALRMYGLDTEGKPLKQPKSRPAPPPIPQPEAPKPVPQKPTVPAPQPSRYQGTEEQQIEMPIPSPELSVPPSTFNESKDLTVPRRSSNRPPNRPETVGRQDARTVQPPKSQDATVPEDAQKTATMELLRAVNHSLITSPSLRPAIKVLTAAKIGKNKEEREKLARHFYDVEARPEITERAATYGENGKPFWQFAKDWTPDPSKYQAPEYSI